MTPPAGYEWLQRDAMQLRCTRCGEVVRAEVVDLHGCGVA